MEPETNLKVVLYIDEMQEEGREYAGKLSPEALDLTSEDSVSFHEPLEYDLHASLVSDELLVQGSLEVTATLSCSRCSASYELEVQEPAYFYDQQIDQTTESVDLTEDMRVAIILAFPSHPVCGVDCKGLCPQCGVNKNMNECNCKPPDDVRWAALDGLG